MSEKQPDGFKIPQGPGEEAWDEHADAVDATPGLAGKEYGRALSADGGYIWSVYCFVCRTIYPLDGTETFSPFRPKPCPKCGSLKCSAEVQPEKRPPGPFAIPSSASFNGGAPKPVAVRPCPLPILYSWRSTFEVCE